MSDDNTRRHWHGSPGDRHQQLNVWMNGGAKSPSGRAAWAMPNTGTRRVGHHLPLWISVSLYTIHIYHSLGTTSLLLLSLYPYIPYIQSIYPPIPHLQTQTNTKMKDSNTSTSSDGNKQTEGTGSNLQSLGERRRSSAGSSQGLFSNLHTQKRESTNADMATRRASWNDQAAKGGMFSKWWEGYTRGSGSK